MSARPVGAGLCARASVGVRDVAAYVERDRPTERRHTDELSRDGARIQRTDEREARCAEKHVGKTDGRFGETRRDLHTSQTHLHAELDAETRGALQVTEMRIVCEEKKTHVATAKVECEELLVHIVKDKRIADEQEKQVTAAAAAAVPTGWADCGAYR